MGSIRLFGPPQIEPRQTEQDETDHDEDAEERVDLPGSRQQQREDAEGGADPVDQQHGLAVRQPDVEEPMVEVAAIGCER